MPITYTNRKGVTYHLCRGVTKTGKPRYYFAREPKGEVLNEIPPGFKISESVNGVVSLIQDRPSPLWPEEVAAVESAVKRHPKVHNYRVDAKGDRIMVYERVGPDAQDLLAEFSRWGPFSPGRVKEFQETLDSHARFTPVLRFILADAERRVFRAERWCYLGSIDDWIYIGQWEPIDQLASELITALGTDEFFELH
jgi:hypothetical protein